MFMIEKLGYDLGVVGPSRLENREKDRSLDIEPPPPTPF